MRTKDLFDFNQHFDFKTQKSVFKVVYKHARTENTESAMHTQLCGTFKLNSRNLCSTDTNDGDHF